MFYQEDKSEKLICSWNNCKSEARSYLSNSNGSETGYFCNFHKKVVAINLDQFDKIRIPESRNKRIHQHPGSNALPKQIPESRPSTDNVEKWQREAALKAENSAVVLPEKPKGKRLISDITAPRTKK